MLIAPGLFGPIGPALLLAVMIVAMTQLWRNGFFAMNNGVESDPRVESVALAVAMVGALATLVVRRHPSPAAAAH